MLAPIGLDYLADMVATLYGEASGNEILVIVSPVSTFVDEAGTGDEPNIVLAALVSNLDGWASFNTKWQEHLNDANLEYAHMLDMRKGRGRYEKWSVNKKQGFTAKSLTIMKQHCWFGFTVCLDKQLYEEKYRKDFPRKASPDSAYAVCAREVFGFAAKMTHHILEYGGPINFIFEEGHRNSTNAAEVFRDLKLHAVDRDRFGFFALADKRRVKPLQAADQIAHQSRRSEAVAVANDQFNHMPEDKYVARVKTGEIKLKCPIYYYPITAEILEFHRSQKLVLRSIKRRERKRDVASQYKAD